MVQNEEYTLNQDNYSCKHEEFYRKFYIQRVFRDVDSEKLC